MEKLNHIVRMDTRLIYEGSFFLPARAMKVLAYVIAKFIDPKAEGPTRARGAYNKGFSASSLWKDTQSNQSSLH